MENVGASICEAILHKIIGCPEPFFGLNAGWLFWIVGLLIGVFGGRLVVEHLSRRIFLDPDPESNAHPDHPAINPINIGYFERSVFTLLIGFGVIQGLEVLVAMGGWITLKMARTWVSRKAYSKDEEIFIVRGAMRSVLLGALSLVFAGIGGAIAYCGTLALLS